MDYFKKKKQTILRVFLGIILKMRFFPKNLSFLPLRHPNFMRSFRKILSTVLEKTRLPTGILNSGEIIGPLFA